MYATNNSFNVSLFASKKNKVINNKIYLHVPMIKNVCRYIVIVVYGSTYIQNVVLIRSVSSMTAN